MLRSKGGSLRRIQDNILAGPERRLLTWLCSNMPRWVTPDRLTAVGLAGAITVSVGGLLSRTSPNFLWLMVLGLFINWAGDSLDGSLARFRDIARPNYGYFIDHSIDGINNFLIMVGLGLTPAVSLSISLFALCAYYLLCMYAFLRRQVLNELRLSYLWVGPTELRLLITANIIGMYFVPDISWQFYGRMFKLYETLLFFTACVFLVIFAYLVTVTATILRKAEKI